MSLLSIDDWQSFLFNVGGDFYDLVHGESENNNEFTRIDYNNCIQYQGVYFIYNDSGNYYDYSIPYIVDFNLCNGVQNIVSPVKLCTNSNRRASHSISSVNSYINTDLTIDCANSYIAYNNPYWIGSDNNVWMRNATQEWHNDIFTYLFSGLIHNSSNNNDYRVNADSYGNRLFLSYSLIDYRENYNGYEDWFGDGVISTFYDYRIISTYNAPSILNTSPVVVNTTNFNSNSTWLTSVRNTYINNGDTITNYIYNIDNNNYITVNYSTDGDGIPTGYIDLQPTGNISFDDLFDMFNTILAPLVGVGLDLPDWNDYSPPSVTGDINVNIDLPDVTGVYPAETITPIESDVYNIMSIDSMPQLPSLTGIDNGETAAALGSSFTFLDGCGLLMPFVTIAIIRLLISKFRGDS